MGKLKNNSTDVKVLCKYCCEQISIDARVCRFCGRNKKWLFNYILSINTFAIFSSLVLIILASAQFWDARIEKEKSIDAAIKAENALSEVYKIEREILLIRDDIIKTTTVLIDIAEILPSSTGYGSGLTKNNYQKLMNYTDSLNIIIKRLNKYKK